MSKGAARVAAIVPEVLGRAARQQGVLWSVQRKWAGLIGRTLAAHTRPVSLRHGRLVVHADRPGEGFALSYERPQLLARLQRATNGRVQEIVIRPGEIKHGDAPCVKASRCRT